MYVYLFFNKMFVILIDNFLLIQERKYYFFNVKYLIINK